MVYDPTSGSPADDVRLLVNDVGDDPVFEDDEIARFLALEADDIYRAAATALVTIAGNETLRAKYIQSRGITLDGPAVGRELRLQAREYRDQAATRPAADEDDDGTFIIAEQQPSHFPERAPHEDLVW